MTNINLWQHGNEVMCICFLSCCCYFFICRILTSISNVFRNSRSKEDWFLTYHTNMLAQPFNVEILNVNSINVHLVIKKFQLHVNPLIMTNDNVKINTV